MATTTTLGSGRDEDLSAKAVRKRYDGLVTVRSKAIKGKGAWYWSHLEPILVQSDTGTAKAVKLRCGLCTSMFSASNPSRTASEHLKRGTCPNFTGAISRPASSSPPSKSGLASSSNARKRSAQVPSQAIQTLPSPTPLATIEGPRGMGCDISRMSPAPLLLSGGKEDLGALALLEDNVKKLKSPGGIKGAPGAQQGLTKAQAESAMNLLAEWLYESWGTVSFSCVEHPKFKAFLQQVGLPPVSARYISGAKLDSKYDEVRQESENRLQDAAFFQLSTDGWKKKGSTGRTDVLVNIIVNLPNGNSLFYRVLNEAAASISPKSVEEHLWQAITSICDADPERCVGIIADADKHTAKALQELEFRNRWMVNLSCQAQGFSSLIKDFNKRLELFKSVISDCFKVASFFKSKVQARSYLQQYQRQENDIVRILRMPPDVQFPEPTFEQVLPMLEDVAQLAAAMKSTVMDDTFKVLFAEDSLASEVSMMVEGRDLWQDLEAVLSLVNIVSMLIRDIEAERPLVSQCIPLWDDLRAKVKLWCKRFNKNEAVLEEIIQRRFAKNYHPAWAAAFILDPLYLLRDNSGRYLPPYKCLTTEQEKDVDKLIMRLVSRDDAHIVLMELMKWRSEGLDPLYAQAVQVKERDAHTGRLKPMNPQSRRLVWETCLSDFKYLGRVASRLIFLHATSCSLKCNWPLWRWAVRHGNSRLALDKAHKMIYIASHAKLERRDFMNEDEKDAELFTNGIEEGMVDEVFMNATL